MSNMIKLIQTTSIIFGASKL